MKKIHHPIRKELPPVKLYLDDIDEIIDILKEEKFSNIEIKTINNQYEDEELKNINLSEPLSEISSHKPIYITISFNSGFGPGINIYTETDTALAYGVVKKIENLFKKRVRKIFSIITKANFALCFFLFALAVANLLNIIDIITETTKWLILLLAAIFFGISMLLDSGKLLKKNIIILKRKKEQLNFWSRNKDQITVNIIVYIIATIISAIITIIITN